MTILRNKTIICPSCSEKIWLQIRENVVTSESLNQDYNPIILKGQWCPECHTSFDDVEYDNIIKIIED